jgi:hypothetical protein
VLGALGHDDVVPRAGMADGHDLDLRVNRPHRPHKGVVLDGILL